ncbi:MAG TPA: PilZ domain-containing protein [Terriglobia bacterium]|nr:PilZ domain-containing protein [Terriglobia bacterium]
MALVIVSMNGDRRCSERFHIECAVTASILGRGKGHDLKSGTLRDIGVGGACFYLGEPLEVGTLLRLQVHFVNPSRGIATMLFEGNVMRAGGEPRYEIALQFRRSGRFLRGSPHALREKQEAPQIGTA